MVKSTKVYFDTNVLNDLAYVRNYTHVFNVMKRYNQVICISEVTIFEILRDQKDLYNIEKVIMMLQDANNICGVIVLPSIDQVLIGYLSHKKISRSESTIIVDVISNCEKTFLYDEEAKEYFLIGFKEVQKSFKDIIKNVNVCDEECDYKYRCNVTFFSQLLFNMFLKFDFSPFYSKLYKKFYNSKKLYDAKKLLKYYDRKCRHASSSKSPFYLASQVMISQANDLSNGVFMDGLHACYYCYVDCYVSNDKHLIRDLHALKPSEYFGIINLDITFDGDTFDSRKWK